MPSGRASSTPNATAHIVPKPRHETIGVGTPKQMQLLDDLFEQLDVACPVSSLLFAFAGFGFECRFGEVDVERACPVEVLVGSDAVVFVDEAVGVVCEVDAVGGVVTVEAFVFEGLEPALDDAVGVRRAVPGAHVGEVRPGSEPACRCC